MPLSITQFLSSQVASQLIQCLRWISCQTFTEICKIFKWSALVDMPTLKKNGLALLYQFTSLKSLNGLCFPPLSIPNLHLIYFFPSLGSLIHKPNVCLQISKKLITKSYYVLSHFPPSLYIITLVLHYFRDSRMILLWRAYFAN